MTRHSKMGPTRVQQGGKNNCKWKTRGVKIKENMKRKKKRGEKNRVNENRRKGVKKIYKIPVTICKENGDNV